LDRVLRELRAEMREAALHAIGLRE
jgi:hypothetical protein